MKCEIIIGTEHEESVIIYARERTKLVEEIESFVLGYSTEIIGYKDKSAVVINPAEVCCFTVEDGKTYALIKHTGCCDR